MRNPRWLFALWVFAMVLSVAVFVMLYVKAGRSGIVNPPLEKMIYGFARENQVRSW